MRLLTSAEARAVLRIDQKTLVKIIDSGALTALRTGPGNASPYRISLKSLSKYTGETEKAIVEFLDDEKARVSAS